MELEIILDKCYLWIAYFSGKILKLGGVGYQQTDKNFTDILPNFSVQELSVKRCRKWWRQTKRIIEFVNNFIYYRYIYDLSVSWSRKACLDDFKCCFKGSKEGWFWLSLNPVHVTPGTLYFRDFESCYKISLPFNTINSKI